MNYAKLSIGIRKSSQKYRPRECHLWLKPHLTAQAEAMAACGGLKPFDVTCDEQDRPTTKLREMQSPRVVIEVLSAGTEAYDKGEKFSYYRACPSVQEYVLVATRFQLVEVFHRTPQGWTEYHVYGPEDEVELTSIDVQLPVSTFYELTDVPETLDAIEGEV